MLRRFAVSLLVAGLAACSDFDTTRQVTEDVGTVGQQLYALLCDRVGASSLPEDLEGASYRRVCHRELGAAWADTVDVSLLPPSQSAARELGIAKIEAMARRRADLVQALDATFPDVKIDAPGGGKIGLHDALTAMLQSMVPLYESNPFATEDGASQPVMPQTTRALARLLDALASSPDARAALAKLNGRGGYRPLAAALGAIRPLLAYPELRPLVQSALGLIGPGGKAEPQLQQLLDVVQRELGSLTVDPPLAPWSLSDAAAAQPNRPRTNYEFVQRVLLAENDAFAASPSEPPRYIAARDPRGFILVAGSAPGVPGGVLAPFADQDADGLADVDAHGRFVGADSAPVAVDTPFFVPGIARVRPPDPAGRAVDPGGGLVFRYVDTSRTATAAAARDLVPLLNPDGGAQHETLMYALAGLQPLLGDRKQITKTDPYALSYIGFDPARSPIADLLHASGQVLADPDSDDLLQSLLDLAENHRPLVARLLGDALAIHADATDPAQPIKAAAALPRTSTVWDEMADWVARVSKVDVGNPGQRSLLEDLLVAAADESTVKLARVMAKQAQFKDHLSYDPSDLNGSPRNLTSNDKQALHVPVDRTTPPSDGADNRSALQRLAQLIHDTNGLKTCNKQGAKLNLSALLSWPILGTYNECELFAIDDMAVFYLESILPADHPRRSKMNIQDGVLNGAMNLIKIFASPDALLEGASGIDGMTLHPSPKGLNRFVYFGSTSDQFGSPPDVDPLVGGNNKQTNKFVSGMIEPLPTAVCPVATSNGTRRCASFDDTARARDAGYLFLGEDQEFYDGFRPLITAFADHGSTHLLVDLFDILYRHWASPAHGPECEKSGTPASNPKYCAEDGIVAYEPILSSAMASDFMLALNEFGKTAVAQRITTARGPNAGRVRDGVAVTADLVKVLFQPDWSGSRGVVDRHGAADTVWSDGATPKPQTTPFDLFANALVAIDDRFASSTDYADVAQRKSGWKRARSQLVDQFLAVDGAADQSTFHNATVPELLPILLRTIREQLNAHCPDREAGGGCTWAQTELGKKAEEALRSPLTVATMDLLDRIRDDEPARRALERLLVYLLSSASDGDALQATLASLSDLAQIMQDDPDLTPILDAASTAAAPGSGPNADPLKPGLAATTIQMLRVLTDPSDTYDPYRAMDSVLRNLVTPIDDAKPSFTPLEVFLDAIAEVQRIDAAQADASLTADDWQAITGGVRDFLASPERGLEQFYTVVQHRNGD